MFGSKREQRPRYWKTPSGEAYNLFLNMAQQPHLLIGGATGSGKSVLLNGIIYSNLYYSPEKVQYILIDPKRTELVQWADLPHTIRYADTAETMLEALQFAKTLTDMRYAKMKARRLKEYDGSHIYVIIDELAALMTTQRKAVEPIIQYLGIIARAARVHLIACTQTVKATVLPTTITCNFDARAALRTATAQQSRMLIDVSGCERLPSPVIEHKALCYFRTGADLQLYKVPKYSDEQIQTMINYWTSPACMVF